MAGFRQKSPIKSKLERKVLIGHTFWPLNNHTGFQIPSNHNINLMQPITALSSTRDITYLFISELFSSCIWHSRSSLHRNLLFFKSFTSGGLRAFTPPQPVSYGCPRVRPCPDLQLKGKASTAAAHTGRIIGRIQGWNSGNKSIKRCRSWLWQQLVNKLFDSKHNWKPVVWCLTGHAVCGADGN